MPDVLPILYNYLIGCKIKAPLSLRSPLRMPHHSMGTTSDNSCVNKTWFSLEECCISDYSNHASLRVRLCITCLFYKTDALHLNFNVLSVYLLEALISLHSKSMNCEGGTPNVYDQY